MKIDVMPSTRLVEAMTVVIDEWEDADETGSVFLFLSVPWGRRGVLKVDRADLAEFVASIHTSAPRELARGTLVSWL